MGSGLIYAAIAVMWAAVLIPMWLRNHDAATENRSAERFGQAMRVLSRKGSAAEGADDLAVDAEPARPASAPQVPVAQPASKPRRQPQPRAARRPTTMAQRRARTLGVLTGLALLTVLVSVLTPLPWWVATPFVLLLGAFVVHLRIQARQQAQRHRRRPAARPAPAPVPEARDHQPADTTGVVQGPSRAVVVERKGEAAPAAAGAAGTSDDESWQPNPLPLPTYVTAPKAIRPIKVIDLTTPGAWSSGRLVDDDFAEEDFLAAQVAEDELDALLDQEAALPSENQENRAVGD